MTEANAQVLRLKMLGAMMRKTRTEAGKSLRETAALIGTSPGRLSAYERAKKSISLPELELLAYQLAVPLGQLWDAEAAVQSAASDIDPDRVLEKRNHAIGELLKTHRDQAGFSNRQLAEETGLTARRVSTYQRGERPIPLPELEALATALDHRIEDYLDQDGLISEWEQDQETINVFLKLPSELREFISDPDNEPFLELAMQLSEIPHHQLRAIGEGLLDLGL